MDNLGEWLDWFVHFNEPSLGEMWENHPTYLAANIVHITIALLSLSFALRQGINSRYSYLWLACLLHGVVTELISYSTPDINSFWHGQTFMIFAGRRFPLYIVLFYPATVMHAYIAASRLRLPWWAEPFAVGLLDVLLDFPYDIMGIKMVWWTWHDTDPNILDRTYWVPWTSYFFHLSFHSSLAFLINGTRYLITGSDSKVKSTGFFKEMTCVLITASLAMVTAVIFQMLPIYHGLKDNFDVPSEVIIFIVFALYTAIAWRADRTPSGDARNQIEDKSSWWKNESVLAVVLHYVFYMVLVVVAKPQDVRSYGMHEPLGPKDQMMDVHSISGAVYHKQRYFDPTDYDEGYIDFHCDPKGTPNISNPGVVGKSWYTVCGNKFENHAEYITIIWAFCFFGLFVYYNVFARSATQTTVDRVPGKKPSAVREDRRVPAQESKISKKKKFK